MKNALEIVTYRIKDGVKVPDFLKASAEMEERFAKKQGGFLSRTFAIVCTYLFEFPFPPKLIANPKNALPYP